MQSSTSAHLAIAPTSAVTVARPEGTSSQAPIASAPINSGNASQGGVILSGILVLVVPAALVLGILGHRKYRAAARQRQIRMLERLWRLNSAEPRH